MTRNNRNCPFQVASVVLVSIAFNLPRFFLYDSAHARQSPPTVAATTAAMGGAKLQVFNRSGSAIGKAHKMAYFDDNPVFYTCTLDIRILLYYYDCC